MKIRKIVAIISFIMFLGQVGNMELNPEISGQAFIKSLILLVIFYLAIKEYIK